MENLRHVIYGFPAKLINSVSIREPPISSTPRRSGLFKIFKQKSDVIISGRRLHEMQYSFMTDIEF